METLLVLAVVVTIIFLCGGLSMMLAFISFFRGWRNSDSSDD